MSDDLNVDAIGARADAATPGPWRALGTGVRGGDHWYVVDSTESIASIHANDGSDEDQRERDAEFIAHARTDIPALIARVRELEAELATDEWCRDESCPWWRMGGGGSMPTHKRGHGCPTPEMPGFEGTAAALDALTIRTVTP